MNDLGCFIPFIVVFVILYAINGLTTFIATLLTAKLLYIFIGIIVCGWFLGVYQRNHPGSKIALYAAGAAFLVVVGGYFYSNFIATPETHRNVNTYSESGYQGKSSAARSTTSVPAESRDSKANSSANTNHTVQTKSQTTSADSIDLSTPDGMFRHYHQLITDHKYQDAYQCFTPDMQTNMGDYTTWAQGYATTVASEPEQVSVLSIDGTNAVLSFYLKATDRVQGKNQVQYFKGSCHLTKINGQWKIAEISAELG